MLSTSFRRATAVARAAVICRPGLRSMTAYFLVVWSSARASSTWMPMLAPHSTGIITMLMMNALVCTAALYSRTATAQTLNMIDPFGARPGDADEDVLERRPGQL